jgi:hypothetical protein
VNPREADLGRRSPSPTGEAPKQVIDTYGVYYLYRAPLKHRLYPGLLPMLHPHPDVLTAVWSALGVSVLRRGVGSGPVSALDFRAATPSQPGLAAAMASKLN